MSNAFSFLDTVDRVITDGVNREVLHRYTEDEYFSGNLLTMNQQQMINFGSCSYLGLEFNEELKRGAMDAIGRFGTQFSSSRAYVSTGQYAKLESLLQQVFGNAVIIAPTTSLAHIATLPVIIGSSDAVIIDHQVHSSVQTAVQLLKPKGTKVEMIRHNRMDILEEKINELKNKHRHIWYMADGIYSMYGDAAPFDQLRKLLDRYEQFHLYADDAHGMSCFGKHGRGFALSQMEQHPRMIVATSFAKAFATGGSAVVFPDHETARKIRTCGGPLITSGPLQPATLGAAIASAKLHLTNEINSMQEDLQQNILYTNLQIEKCRLPLVAKTPSPVFFIGVSLPKVAYSVLQKMMRRGFYLNIGTFPAVPMKNTGIRFTITRLHTFEQIENMIHSLRDCLAEALEEENFTLEGIYKAFGNRVLPVSSMETGHGKNDHRVNSITGNNFSITGMPVPPVKEDLKNVRPPLRLVHKKSITEISAAEWDAVFADKGSFDYNGLRLLEKTFVNEELPENKWEFDYLLVKTDDKIVGAVFLTTALMKDDMLAPAEISEQVEEIRKISGEYYKTSRVLMAGSMLTEGEHFYIDKSFSGWPGVKLMLLDKINELQDCNDAQVVILRDLDFNDQETEKMMLDNGYFKSAMPDKFIIDYIKGKEIEEYIALQSYKTRRHIRSEILKYSYEFQTEIIRNPSQEEKKLFYRLYENVKSKNLELNTFGLPEKFFENVYNDPSWEIMAVRKFNDIQRDGKGKIITVVFIHAGRNSYNPMVIGIDYSHGCKGSPYRQALFQFVVRATELGKGIVNLGFSAAVEKKKIGGKPVETAAYVYARDNYIFESLASYNISNKHVPVSR